MYVYVYLFIYLCMCVSTSLSIYLSIYIQMYNILMCVYKYFLHALGSYNGRDLLHSCIVPRSCQESSMRNPGGHTWHAVSIIHRCRASAICDATCERLFSLVHLVYDADTSLPPDRVCNRLQLKEAGLACLGSQRDEAVIEELALAMPLAMT